jgi:RimJ/RimL family protein N-acetyltransferase
MTAAAAGPGAYPRERERRVRLRDGAAVRLRPIRPEDAPRLIELSARLSPATAYQRFFTALTRLPAEWARTLATVDYERRYAVVAEVEAAGEVQVVGVGRYEPTDRADTAEVAFLVEDTWQNRGLGTALLLDVLDAAGERGIHRFRAWVLGENVRMLHLLQRHGEIQARALERGVVDLTFTPRWAASARPEASASLIAV